MNTIFVPGQGHVDLDYVRMNRAINEYDERLNFEMNDQTGQYTIFMKNVHGEAPIPVLAFTDIPTTDEAIQRLHQTDARRHGAEILDRMRAENERHAAAFDNRSSEAAGQLAEAHESYLRNNGQLRYSKSFRADPNRTAVKKG